MCQVERDRIEYKTASKGRIPEDIWQTVSAFSNAEGGKVYFGVHPDGKTQESLTNGELDKIQRDLLSCCRNEFNIKLAPEIKVEDNAIVVAIFEPIPAAHRPVYHLKQGMEHGTYVRVGSANIKADADMLKRLITASQGGAETFKYPYAWQDVLDQSSIEEYIKLLNQRNDNVYQRFTTKEVLIKQKAITSDERVTLFGLLAFGLGREPQDIISPTTNIAVTVYPGAEKVDSKDFSETYKDNREFNGPVAKQFNEAFEYIVDKLPVRGIITNGIRRDEILIPTIAIREALANAIVHRDYSTGASRVQVDIFSNRIEIINPGNSLVPVEELDRAPSTSRNPLLMNFLKEYGITDQKGRGIRTIVSSLRDHDLIEPRFENSGKSFRVTLYGQSIFTKEDKDFIEQLNMNLSERQEKAIAHVRNHPEGITNSIYREINNMQKVRDDKRANKELRDLVDKSVFIAEGNGKGRKYKLN